MLRNLSTKKKLFLFPVLFVLIVVVSAFIYKYYSNLANTRNHVAITTDEFVQQLLKGRISIFIFLREPTEKNREVAYNAFNQLDKNVAELQTTLVTQKNKKLCDDILSFFFLFISDFESLF